MSSKRLDLIVISRASILFCFFLLFISFLFWSYFCPDSDCSFGDWSNKSSKYVIWTKPNYQIISEYESLSSNFVPKKSSSSIVKLFSSPNLMSFDNIISDPNFVFDFKGNHVIVFLHIQKTGGTSFGRHLVRDLDLETPCECKKGKKRCKCTRPNSSSDVWLFSRYTTGWICGLHADWTELTSCVKSAMDKDERKTLDRRYFYITMLREPVTRFISEFRHIKRGATWKNSYHLCGGRFPNRKELPPCYEGKDWKNVSLKEYMNCESNLAINRQTRMLADLRLVNCYNRSSMSIAERERILLASAKKNLRKMAFFGISEYQKISQYVFESVFKLKFLRSFIQLNETHSTLAMKSLNNSVLDQVKQLNYLDIKLYNYACELLKQRFEKFKKLDKNFSQNYGRPSNLSIDKMSPEYRLMKKIPRLKKLDEQ